MGIAARVAEEQKLHGDGACIPLRRRLDGREHPGVEAGRTRERPERADGLEDDVRTLHEGTCHLVRGFIEHRAADVRGHVVPTVLVPRFRDLGPDLDLLDVARVSEAPQPLGLRPQLALQLRRDAITEGADVPAHPRVVGAPGTPSRRTR